MAKLMLSVNSEDWTIIEEGSQNCDHCPLRFIDNNPTCEDCYKKLFGKSCDDIRVISRATMPKMRVESFIE